MKKVTKTLQVAAVSALLAAGTVVASASAAQAAPSNCSDTYTTYTYEVFCGKGNGEFQAVVRCYRIGSSNYTTRYGQWRRPNTVRSVAKCTTSEEPASGYWRFR